MAAHSNAAVVGTGYSKIARRSDTCIGELAVDACEAAVEDAGLRLADIDGIASYARPAEQTPGMADGIDFAGVEFLVNALGLKDLKWYATIDRAHLPAALVHAIHAVESGRCNYALVFRAVRNPHGVLAVNRYTERHAEHTAEFWAPYGVAGGIATYALKYARYLARYGATREHLATFIVNNRMNASRNPDAVFFDKPITRDAYLDSKMVSWPVSVLDCDMPVDGAGALIVTTADRAKSLRQPPTFVAGFACQGFDYRAQVVETWEGDLEATRLVANDLWRRSGFKPSEIDMASLYDGFSFFTYLWLEAFGFCNEGEAFEFIQDGRIEVGGELPLNTSGGSLGMGRVHGSAQLIEAVRQIQGRCGQRQVDDVNLTIANAGAPMWGMAPILFAKGQP